MGKRESKKLKIAITSVAEREGSIDTVRVGDVLTVNLEVSIQRIDDDK